MSQVCLWEVEGRVHTVCRVDLADLESTGHRCVTVGSVARSPWWLGRDTFSRHVS